MSGLDKNRHRNKTISFRVSPEERQQLEARIKVCGIPKGKYIIQSVLHNQINVVAGKYLSDRLSLEIRRLREQIDKFDTACQDKQLMLLIEDCKALLSELKEVSEKHGR